MKNATLKSLSAALVLAGLTLSTAACNTVQGLGDDVKSVGEAGERAID